MQVVLKWSVPVSRFPGESEDERMIEAQDAIEDIEAEVSQELERELGVLSPQPAVSAQFMEFYDLPDGGHGRDTQRARFLVSIDHIDAYFISSVASRFGGEVSR